MALRASDDSTGLERSAVDGACAPAHEQRDDVVVIRPRGGLDQHAAAATAAAISASDRPVILDLDDCVLTHPRPLDVLEVGASEVEMCIVSRRLTCRRLLARAGLTFRFAVFTRVEDALQARAHQRHGYGRGWSLS